METRWSWVQPLDSTVASSELRYIYEIYNREVGKLGFESACSANNLPIV